MNQIIQNNATPLSVQLYALRRECVRDFDAVLTRLSGVGFAGVELFNLFGMTPGEFRKRVEDLGMRVSSSQFPCANRAPVNLVIDTLSELGLTRATCEFSPDDFRDHDAILHTAEIINTLAGELARHGISVILQNHWWEYETLDAELKYPMLQALCPDAQFAIDTYWAANFGKVNVPAEVRRVADRTPMLIIKDGLFLQAEPFTNNPSIIQNDAGLQALPYDESHVAVGSGRADINAIIAAADPNVIEWLVVGLDTCATDVMTAITESHRFLTGMGLAHGRI